MDEKGQQKSVSEMMVSDPAQVDVQIRKDRAKVLSKADAAWLLT